VKLQRKECRKGAAKGGTGERLKRKEKEAMEKSETGKRGRESGKDEVLETSLTCRH